MACALGVTRPGPSERLVPRGPGKTNDVDGEFFAPPGAVSSIPSSVPERGHKGDGIGRLFVMIPRSSPNLPSGLHGSNGHYRGERKRIPRGWDALTGLGLLNLWSGGELRGLSLL